MEMLSQLILDVLDGRPGTDRQGALAALFVMHVLDEDFKVRGGLVVGEAIVVTHDAVRYY